MRRREDRAISKHTLNLFAGDYEWLQSHYSSRIGAAKVIRDLVHAHRRRIEERAAQRPEMPVIDELNFEELEDERLE